MKYLILSDSEVIAEFKSEYDRDICLLTLQEESLNVTLTKAITG